MRSRLNFLFAAILCSSAAFSQPTTPVFSSSTFYHVEDAQRQAYVDFTKNQSRKLFEALIQENQAIRGIVVTEVTYGGNPEPRANFVLSILSDGPPAPPASFDPVVRKALGMSYDEYMHKARALRTRVGQVLSQNVVTEGTEPIREGDLVRIDYMKIAEGRAADYYNMERNDYRPLHAQRIKDGGMKRWSLYAAASPPGRTGRTMPTQRRSFRIWPALWPRLATANSPGRRTPKRTLPRCRNAAGLLANWFAENCGASL